MSRTPSKSIEEQIYEAKLKIVKATEDYQTQLYFETMPEYDPSYKYCFQSSNRSIANENQSIDAWLRAVIKHMALRLPGHGGAVTKAQLISIPENLSDKTKDIWIEYETQKLRKKVTSRKLKSR